MFLEAKKYDFRTFQEVEKIKLTVNLQVADCQ